MSTWEGESNISANEAPFVSTKPKHTPQVEKLFSEYEGFYCQSQ